MDGDGTYRHDDLLSRCGRYPVQEGRADSPLQDYKFGEIGAPGISLPLPRPCNASVTGKADATCDGTLRQQALDELLNDLREYAAASPAFRPYWRRLALHDIARFRRDFLVPERAAFEAAVRRSQQRRAA